MLFYGRAVEDYLPLPRSKSIERDICTHSHLAADINHQRPHESIPRSNGSLLYRKAFIRHQSRLVHPAHCPRSLACGTCPLTVERKLFRRRGKKAGAAFRTNKLPACGHTKRRLQIMAVWTAMAGKTRIYKAQTVQQLRPVPKVLRMPGIPGRWCIASEAGT